MHAFDVARLATLLESVSKQVRVEVKGRRQALISLDRLYHATDVVTCTIPLSHWRV